MNWQSSASVDVLVRRAEIIRSIRQWFHQHKVLEVETPQLSLGATTDPHIESFSVGERHLRTSAEFHLKRMLSCGYPDIYELGKVFRVDESGCYHNPEFTMLEWYRKGIDHHQLITEVESLLQVLTDDLDMHIQRISYRELWRQVCDLDIAICECNAITDYLTKSGVSVPESITENFDALQDLAMGTVVADALPKNLFTCIYDYPASQASLARVVCEDPDWPVASRFEIYHGSVELANGYHELKDPVEQLSRLSQDNKTRVDNQQSAMPVDMNFIAALEHGLPDCAGVAIGIDRLMMILIEDITSLDQVIGFKWAHA